jgi:hypothetical protein
MTLLPEGERRWHPVSKFKLPKNIQPEMKKRGEKAARN